MRTARFAAIMLLVLATAPARAMTDLHRQRPIWLYDVEFGRRHVGQFGDAGARDGGCGSIPDR
jgi:hypothetical protein